MTPLDSSSTSQVAPVFVFMIISFLVVLLPVRIVVRKEEEGKDERAVPKSKQKVFPDILSRTLTMSH